MSSFSQPYTVIGLEKGFRRRSTNVLGELSLAGDEMVGRRKRTLEAGTAEGNQIRLQVDDNSIIQRISHAPFKSPGQHTATDEH